MVNRKKSNRYRKTTKISLILVFVLAIFFYFGFAYPFRGTFFNKQRHGNPPLTPPWALECWLWEDDYNTAEYVDTLLAGYKKYDIPVRTILLDSPWRTVRGVCGTTILKWIQFCIQIQKRGLAGCRMTVTAWFYG